MHKTVTRTSEKGQSLAEMAISLTILLILIGGLIDGSRLFYSYMALRDAAQEGVNYAMYNPTDTTGIINSAVTSSTQPINLANDATVTVTQPATTPYCRGKTVTVTVTIQFKVTAAFFGSIIGSQTLPLSATSTGTILTPACS
jgi:Flp pilus assembly protein TadG